MKIVLALIVVGLIIKGIKLTRTNRHDTYDPIIGAVLIIVGILFGVGVLIGWLV